MKFLKTIGNFFLFLWRVTLIRFIVFFCIAPVLICFWLFGAPWYKTPLTFDINSCSFQSTRVVADSPMDSRSFILSKLFQVSFGLDRYKVCLVNRNQVFFAGRRVDNKENKEFGAIEYTIGIYGNGNTSTLRLYSQISDSPRCTPFSYSGTGELSVIPTLMVYSHPETTEPICTSGEVDFSKTELYYQPDVIAYIIKLFAIFVLWSAFILGLHKLWSFADVNRERLQKYR
ncbi:MAG: hypothetical protein PHC70_03415 [Patescibacteria group bacterium]|nr:hypothetical protein [Patescibacteria group bacterium]